MYRKRLLLLILLMGLLVAGFFAYYIYNALFVSNTSFEGNVRYVYVSSDANYGQVRSQLDTLLQDMDTFEAVAKRKNYIGNLRPGRFPIEAGMNNNDIVNSLRSRNTPIRVAFNNQETPYDLAGRISAQIEADSAALVGAMLDPEFLKQAGLDRHTAIAPYLPNTYEFYWNTSAEEFRDRMWDYYQQYWNEERRALARKQGLSPEEVLTLASIVQKETAKTDERPRVAGVYLNRLREGMALQADPTVIYGIKFETGNYDTIIKRVLYRDLEFDTPYNTYMYKGLPPGPIFMPDLSAVEAVLRPEKHNYFYFVVDVSNFGYHMFAESLAQHNRNKAQYIRWINAQGIRR